MAETQNTQLLDICTQVIHQAEGVYALNRGLSSMGWEQENDNVGLIVETTLSNPINYPGTVKVVRAIIRGIDKSSVTPTEYQVNVDRNFKGNNCYFDQYYESSQSKENFFEEPYSIFILDCFKKLFKPSTKQNNKKIKNKVCKPSPIKELNINKGPSDVACYTLSSSDKIFYGSLFEVPDLE